MTGNDALDFCPGQYLAGPGKQQVQGYQDLCITVVELVLQFPFGIERVVHGGHRTDTKCGIICDHHLGDIGEQHRHLVSLTHTEINESFCKGIHQSVETLVGDLFSHIDQRNGIRESPRRPCEDLGHGNTFKIKFSRNTGMIALVPDTFKAHRPPPGCFMDA